MKFTVWIFALVFALASMMPDAHAEKRKKKRSKKSGQATVMVDVGVGPAGFVLTGPVADDQLFHPGLRLSVAAIIDRATVKKNAHRIPRKYRKQIAKLKGPIRIYPFWWLPRSLILSPKINNTGIFGVNFRPIGIGLALSQNPRLGVGIGLDLSYAYIDSEAFPSPTHFLRPGLDITADVELPLSRTFLVSVGWTSAFYPPQELGGKVFEWGDPDRSVWHMGQLFLQLHFRFPYTVNL